MRNIGLNLVIAIKLDVLEQEIILSSRVFFITQLIQGLHSIKMQQRY